MHRRNQSSLDLRLVEILSLLDEELSRKSFLLGSEVSACDHFLFMLASWCEGVSQPPTSFKNMYRFMREMCERTAVKNVCEFEKIDIQLYLR